MLPTRVHAIVLVSKLHKPTMRALAYAKATRPNVLEAVLVDADDERSTARSSRSGTSGGIDVPLKVLYSPYREVIRPIVRVRRGDPRGQPARRGRGLHPGVRRRPLVGAAAAQPDRAAAQGPAAVHARGMVTSVPYQLRSLEAAKERDEWRPSSGARPGDVRRGRRRSQRPRRTIQAGATGLERSTVGPVAHGGHCVARTRRARCVFVRHALPGERVVVEVTEGDEGDRFLRADAVEVLEAVAATGSSRPARTPVRARCGGCDFQHVDARRSSGGSRRRSSPSSCRGWPGSSCEVTVEAVRRRRPALAHPGAVRGRPPGGRPGLRQHRSHDVVAVDDCLIAHPDCPVIEPSGRRGRVEAIVSDRRAAPLVTTATATSPTVTCAARHAARFAGRRPTGFWQVHAGAPRLLVEAVLDVLAPAAGGARARPVRRRRAVRGPWPSASGLTGSVVAVEGDRVAVATTRDNLADLP